MRAFPIFSMCFLLTLLQGCAMSKASEQLTVYYLPFQYQTYLPVTPTTIECRAEEVWYLEKGSELALRLLELAEPRSTSEVSEAVIRAKISGLKAPIYIDADGFASDGKNHYFFKPEAVRQFRRQLPSEKIDIPKRDWCLSGPTAY